MAQAARLNLRMQKEFKLLLTDPPPNVSLPMLSTDLSSSSLSSIDARIEGPEGTVYAGGIFNIKIQIPDRYPFQPPNVTFATPIYHPNIDNGGRICLDILNLPPKGAWQPSLNVSTVLTSIGLLLTEPNPDDGLMCEASREYKYNRQTFDQKARSMTQRYAKAGTSGDSTGDGSFPDNLNPSMKDVQGLEQETKNVDNEYATNHKKLRAVSSNLSLESSGPYQRKDSGGKENVTGIPQSLLSNSKILAMASLPPMVGNHVQHAHQDHSGKAGNDNINMSCKKLCGIVQKPLMESPCSLHMRNVDGKANVVHNRKLSLSQSQSLSMDSSKLSLMPHDGKLDVQQSCQLSNEKAENSKYDEQQSSQGHIRKSELSILEQHEGEPSPITEAVIVLDSEDSEEEVHKPTKSRLSLGRKRLLGKLNVKA